MVMNLFVGGIPFETSQEELDKLFSACGRVITVKIIFDRETGRSKGFGFVEMADEPGGRAAISKLNGFSIQDRKLFVSEAKPPEARGAKPDAIRPFDPGAPKVFVERRVGPRDRRRPAGESGPSASAPDRRERYNPFAGEKSKPFAAFRKWEDKKSGEFGGPKKWGERKPGGFGGPKRWSKPSHEGAKPAGKFGGPKKWGPKPGGSKPSFGGPGKKAHGPNKWGGKPGGFKKHGRQG